MDHTLALAYSFRKITGHSSRLAANLASLQTIDLASDYLLFDVYLGYFGPLGLVGLPPINDQWVNEDAAPNARPDRLNVCSLLFTVALIGA